MRGKVQEKLPKNFSEHRRAYGLSTDGSVFIYAAFDYKTLNGVKKVRTHITVHAQMSSAQVQVYDPEANMWHQGAVLYGEEIKSMKLVDKEYEEFLRSDFEEIQMDIHTLLQEVEWLYKEVA